MTKLEWFEKNGFNENGETYAVAGNSYSIKDQLKEAGYKFNTLLKWHGTSPISLEAEFRIVKFNFDELYQWNDEHGLPLVLDCAKDIAESRLMAAQEPSNSEYIGVIGERLKYLPAVLKNWYGFSGAYNYTNVYTFESEGNIFVWFTATTQNIEKGQKLLLSGTVKNHNIYQGAKTTILTRCSIKIAKE